MKLIYIILVKGEEALQEFSSLDNVDGNAISGFIYSEDSEIGGDGHLAKEPLAERVQETPLLLSLEGLEKDVEQKLISEEELKVGIPCIPHFKYSRQM